MNIGPNIRRFRDLRRMTLVELARRLETHPSNVKRWEMGKVSPRWESVVRIAEALEVPVEDLAAGAPSSDTAAGMRAIAKEHLATSLPLQDAQEVDRLEEELESSFGRMESAGPPPASRVEQRALFSFAAPRAEERSRAEGEVSPEVFERQMRLVRPRRRPAEEPATTAQTLANRHATQAEEYRQLSRFLRHPKFRELRAVIARLPEEMGQKEVRELVRVVEEFLAGGQGGSQRGGESRGSGESGTSGGQDRERNGEEGDRGVSGQPQEDK